MGCEQSIQTQPIKQRCQIQQHHVSHFLQKFKSNLCFDSFIDDFKGKLKSSKSERLTASTNVWNKMIEKFQDLWLDKNQKIELLHFMAKFLKSTFKHGISEDVQGFQKQVGQKIEAFEKRVVLKYKLCLKVFKYTSKSKKDQTCAVSLFNQDYLKFDINFDEVKNVAAKVREFCDYDMEAFSLLSLYFIHSINSLHKQGKSFADIQSLLQQNFHKLQKIYPANESKEDENLTPGSIDLNSVKLVQIPEILTFRKHFKTHYQQLEDYILQKAQQAKEDEQDFVNLVKSICLQKGYAFKSGVKIKSKKNVSSVQRTAEKLLSNDKFEPILKEWKQNKIDLGLNSNVQTQKGLRQYVDSEKQLIMQKVKQILQEQTSLQFTSKDLLRGKCMFNTIQEITQTLEKLRLKIQEQNYSIFQIKDRLGKKTRDLTIVINMPHSRAQLQLCLKFDKVANQFNHKIYELMRSIRFTPITNLQIHNQKWTNDFFNAQLQIFGRMLEKSKDSDEKNHRDFEQNIEFNELSQEVERFVRVYLQSDYLGLEIETLQQRKGPLKIIERSLNELNSILEEDFDILGSSTQQIPLGKQNKQKQQQIAQQNKESSTVE